MEQARVWIEAISTPFHLTFFMMPIWIRLASSVSIKSHEIKVRGTKPKYYNVKIMADIGSYMRLASLLTEPERIYMAINWLAAQLMRSLP